MIKRTFHALSLFLVLFATWYLLSGINSPLFFAFGAVSSALATLLALRMQVVDQEGHPFHLAFSAPLYWLWLLKEMVKSGLTVTRIVWSPELRISPNFAWLHTKQLCDLGRTIYANSITMTPGSVCVEIKRERVFIHALEQSSIDELAEGGMDNRILKLVGMHAPRAAAGTQR